MSKKNGKTPLPLKIAAWLFPKLEAISPWLAKRTFVRIFITPVRYKIPDKEKAVIDLAHKFTIEYQGKCIQCYRWGSGKPLLFVHGWMGRASQFRKFIPKFLEVGYQIYAFDALAHGQSQGTTSNLAVFYEIIEKLIETHGPFASVIGHSLGGVAALHVVHRGANVENLIMISSPTQPDKIINEFLRRLNGSPSSAEYLDRFIFKKLNKHFEEFTATYIARTLPPVNLLLVHDENDIEVGLEQAQALHEIYPRSEMLVTQGLGHTRILKDDEVIERCLQFVSQGTLNCREFESIPI